MSTQMTEEEQRKFEELLAQAGPIIAQAAKPVPIDNSSEFLPPASQQQRAQLGDLPLTTGKVPPIPLTGPTAGPMSLASASEAPKPPAITLPELDVTADPQEVRTPAASTAAQPAAQPAATDQYGPDEIMKLYAQRIMAAQNPTAEQRQLNSKWGQAESQSLDRLTGKGRDGENIGMALASLIPAAVGTIGALTDRSQSTRPGMRAMALGKVAEAASNTAQGLYKDREARNAQALTLADKASDVRRQLGDKSIGNLGSLVDKQQERARLELAFKNLGLRIEGLDMQHNAQDAKLNPAHPQAVAARGVIYKYAPQLTGTLDSMGMDALTKIQKQIEQNTKDAHFGTEYAQAVTKASGVATATTNATSAANSANAPVDAVAKGIVAEGSATGQNRAADADAGGKFLAPLGRDVSDPDRVDRIAKNPPAAKAAGDRMEASRNLLELSRNMADLRRQEAQGLITPGEAKSKFATMSIQFQGALALANGMGTIQEGDRAAIGTIAGQPDMSWHDMASWFTSHDIKESQLEGVYKALLESDKRLAEGYGYGGYSKGGKATKAAVPKTKPAATSVTSDWSKFGL